MLSRNEISVRRVPYEEMNVQEQMWVDHLTKWEFKIPQCHAQKIHEAVSDRIDVLYTRMANFGGPALGEWTEEFSWLDVCIPNSLVHSIIVNPLEGEVQLFVSNRPENREDMCDPDHEEWKTGSSLQWVDVANFMRRVIFEGVVEW